MDFTPWRQKITNDLETDEINQALSAAMGKKLQDEKFSKSGGQLGGRLIIPKVGAGDDARSLRLKSDEDNSGFGLEQLLDSDAFNLLLTDEDDADGDCNSLRPFAIRTSDGALTLGKILQIGEEGTFTPVIIAASGSGQTHSAQIGYYCKLGRLVYFNLHAALSAKGTLSGGVSIAGLPFVSTPKETSKYANAYGMFCYIQGATTAYHVGFYIGPGSASIVPYWCNLNTSGNWAVMTVTIRTYP